jgi:hypothetical protein
MPDRLAKLPVGVGTATPWVLNESMLKPSRIR